MIAEHPNDLVRDQYVMKLSSRLDIDADRLRDDRCTRAADPRRRDRTARRSAERRRSSHVDRRELDALRLAVHAPELMSGRLDAALFADPLARSAFEAVTQWPWQEASSTHRPRSRRCCSGSRSRIPTTGGPREELATRVVVNLVEASSQRLLASMLRRDDPRTFRGQVDARRAREREGVGALGFRRRRGRAIGNVDHR